MSSQKVPKGYKQTEVGVIPEDWDVYKIQELIDQKIIVDHLDGNHGELYPRSNEFTEYGVPYITANDLESRFVSFQSCKFLSPDRASLFRKGIARNGDVIFAHNATVGPVALLSTSLEYVILSTTATYFRCSPEKLSNSFFFYLLQSTSFIRQYQPIMSQSTRNQVPITTQRKLLVPLPPTIDEQKLIARALSDIDALIEGLEGTIGKKRHIKQGAMQELLRSKDDWVESQLSELFNISAGGDLRKDEFSQEYDDAHPFPIYSNAISAYGLYGYCSTKDYSGNCITITARGSVGHAVARNNNFAAIGRLLVLEPINNTSCAFVTECINLWIDFANESTGVPQLTAPQASKYTVRLPNSSEQTRIATILSDMDTEIATLEAKLTKTRQLKQGMMHELLTGRIRLV
jgi:type I restriction enzyme, S subunit